MGKSYYFSVDDGGPNVDPDPVVLPDAKAARAEAIRLLGQMLTDDPQQAAERGDVTISVSDAEGLILFQMSFIVTRAAAASAI
jgi:hypothetical protein